MLSTKEIVVVNRLFFVEFEQYKNNISGTEGVVSFRLFYDGIQKQS